MPSKIKIRKEIMEIFLIIHTDIYGTFRRKASGNHTCPFGGCRRNKCK